MTEELGFELSLDQPYEEAVGTVTAALKQQGFGILTRADVQATLKEKLNVDFRPYTILGACNPPLAYKALQAAPEVGLLLPCNVTVEESEPGQCLVRIANPATMVLSVNRPDVPVLTEVANDALAKIQKVVAALKAQKSEPAVNA